MSEIMQVMEDEVFVSWVMISIIIIFAILVAVVIITRLILACLRTVDENSTMKEMDEIAKEYVNRPYEISQMVFEIIICNTCIIVMMYVYYWLFNNMPFLEGYFGIIMIVLIIIAILINDFLDVKLEQDMIKEEDKGNLRLLSSCSIILIFLLLKIYFKTVEYDEFLLCYIGLVIGRFIYFDSTCKEFFQCIKKLMQFLIPLIIALILTVIISGIGLHLGIITAKNIFFSLIISHLEILFCIHLTKELINTLMI